MTEIKIGENLKKARQECGYTQAEIAEMMEVSNKTISRWETGSTLISAEDFRCLCEIYKVNPNSIMEIRNIPNGDSIEEKSGHEIADEKNISLSNINKYTLSKNVSSNSFSMSKENVRVSKYVVSFILFYISKVIQKSALLAIAFCNLLKANKIMNIVELTILGCSTIVTFLFLLAYGMSAWRICVTFGLIIVECSQIVLAFVFLTDEIVCKIKKSAV